MSCLRGLAGAGIAALDVDDAVVHQVDPDPKEEDYVCFLHTIRCFYPWKCPHAVLKESLVKSDDKGTVHYECVEVNEAAKETMDEVAKETFGDFSEEFHNIFDQVSEDQIDEVTEEDATARRPVRRMSVWIRRQEAMEGSY